MELGPEEWDRIDKGGSEILLKPYYQRDGITLYQGDCREMIHDLKFYVILTDPPYGINHPTDYRSRGRGNLANSKNYPPVFGDDKPFDPSPFTRYPCLLFGGNHFSDRLPVSSGWIVWDKERPEELDQATAELAWTNFVKGVRVFRHRWNGMFRDSDDPIVHPTQKPVALMHWIMKLKWTPQGIVCDPFGGSGSTAVAAKIAERECIIVEHERRYLDITIDRLRQVEMF